MTNKLNFLKLTRRGVIAGIPALAFTVNLTSQAKVTEAFLEPDNTSCETKDTSALEENDWRRFPNLNEISQNN